MGEPLSQAFTAPKDMDSHRSFTASHSLGYSFIGLILNYTHQNGESLVPWKSAYCVKNLGHGLLLF